MKTIKFICWQCVLAAMCACGNTNPNSQNPTQAAESNVEVVMEQESLFYNITLEKALEKAKTENKYVLVDFHTSTCAPCRKMEQEVFTAPECKEFVNSHFVPIAIDGEDDGTGTELAKKYQVFIFPTYLILSPDSFKEGEILGAEYDVTKFIDMLKSIIHAE